MVVAQTRVGEVGILAGGVTAGVEDFRKQEFGQVCAGRRILDGQAVVAEVDVVGGGGGLGASTLPGVGEGRCLLQRTVTMRCWPCMLSGRASWMLETQVIAA